MDVLEQEHRRASQRERLDEDAGREEDRLAVGDLVRSPSEPEEHLELRRVLLGGGRPDDLGDGCSRAWRAPPRVVAVEDACAICLTMLRERAVRRARPVRRRAAAHDAPTLASDVLRELEPQAGLADPGGAEDGDELRSTLADDALPERGEDVELARRGRPSGRAPSAARPPSEVARSASQARTGALLPLAENGLRRLVLDRVARAA